MRRDSAINRCQCFPGGRVANFPRNLNVWDSVRPANGDIERPHSVARDFPTDGFLVPSQSLAQRPDIAVGSVGIPVAGKIPGRIGITVLFPFTMGF